MADPTDYQFRPKDLPRWANDPIAPGDVVDPPVGQKDDGWQFKQRPPYNWMNWLQRNYYQWTRHLSKSFVGIGMPDLGIDTPISPPEVTDLETYDTFDIGEFNLIATNCHKVNHNGELGWSVLAAMGAAISPLLVGYRADAIYFDYDATLCTGEIQYAEDIFSSWSDNYPVVADGNYVLAIVLISSAADGTIESVVQMPNLTPAFSGVTNQVLVKAPRSKDAGAFYTMLFGIQIAIDYLVNNGGGVVKLVGDEFGMIDWDLWGSAIKMKSGVIIDGVNKAVVTSSATAPAPVEHLFSFEGIADSTGVTQNTNELYDAGKDFRADCGLLSLVEIRSGDVDEGWYRIREFEESIPGYGYDTMVLINRDGTDVTPFANASPIDYTVHIYRAGLRNMIVDSSYLNGVTTESVWMYHANKCFFENVDFRNNNLAAGNTGCAVFGADVNDCKFKNCTVDGLFNHGVYLVAVQDALNWNNDDNTFFHNQIDLSTAPGGFIKGIQIASNNVLSAGRMSGNQIFVNADPGSVEVDVPDGYLDRAFAAVYTEAGFTAYATYKPPAAEVVHNLKFLNNAEVGCFDNTSGCISVTDGDPHWIFTARQQMRLRVSAFINDGKGKNFTLGDEYRLYVYVDWPIPRRILLDRRVCELGLVSLSKAVGGTIILDLKAGESFHFEISCAADAGDVEVINYLHSARCSIEELKKEF